MDTRTIEQSTHTIRQSVEYIANIEAAIDREKSQDFPAYSNTAEPLKAESQQALVDEALGGSRKDLAKLEAAIAKAEHTDAGINPGIDSATKRASDQVGGLELKLAATLSELERVKAERSGLILEFVKDQAKQTALVYGEHARDAIEALTNLVALDAICLELTGYKRQTGVLPNANLSIKLPAVVGVEPIPNKRHTPDGYIIDSFKHLLFIDEKGAGIRKEIDTLMA